MKKETLLFAEWISKNAYSRHNTTGSWHKDVPLLDRLENASNPGFDIVANSTEELYHIWKAEIYIDPKNETMEQFIERSMEECNFDVSSIPEDERDIKAFMEEHENMFPADTMFNFESNKKAFDFVFGLDKKEE